MEKKNFFLTTLTTSVPISVSVQNSYSYIIVPLITLMYYATMVKQLMIQSSRMKCCPTKVLWNPFFLSKFSHYFFDENFFMDFYFWLNFKKQILIWRIIITTTRKCPNKMQAIENFLTNNDTIILWMSVL